MSDDRRVPYLVGPAITDRTLAHSGQPTIPVSDSALLRPWTPGDADAVIGAFEDSAIQWWHTR